MKKLYVGNLSYDVNEDHLNELFADCGQIAQLNLIVDKFSGRSKGFAFVEFSEQSAVDKALELNGNDFHGRPLRISIARERSREGGGGRRSGSGGGFGGKRQHNWN
ncbi:MAG: RNA-binding protein [Pseudomonadota bacterium]